MDHVAFIDRMTIEIPGQVLSNSICCSDVDNDNEFELCIGSSLGTLHVYKGLNPDPWRILEKLGHVTAVACGDLFNRGENVLVVISADGHCKVFNFKDYVDEEEEEMEEQEEGAEEKPKKKVLLHCFYQRLPPNIQKAEIGDVNGDGLHELIVTLTDRVVRTYQFRKFTTSSTEETDLVGELSALKKWEFGNQIGGAAVCQVGDDLDLLVTHPGGLYHKINLKMQQFQSYGLNTINMLEEEMMAEATPEIVTMLKNPDGNGSELALAGSDGTVAYMKDDQVVWTRKLDGHLFSLRKLDINLDGKDELLISSWEGKTFVINQNGDVSTFHFDEDITAFSCGLMTIQDKSTPILIFATFNEMVHVYYKVTDYERRQLTKSSLSLNGQALSPIQVSKLLYG